MNRLLRRVASLFEQISEPTPTIIPRRNFFVFSCNVPVLMLRRFLLARCPRERPFCLSVSLPSGSNALVTPLSSVPRYKRPSTVSDTAIRDIPRISHNRNTITNICAVRTFRSLRDYSLRACGTKRVTGDFLLDARSFLSERFYQSGNFRFHFFSKRSHSIVRPAYTRL